MPLPIHFLETPIYKRELATRSEEGGNFYRSDLQPGDAKWCDYEGHPDPQLSFVCPCGCGMANQMPVYSGETGYGWKWNGDRVKPTLTPSIQQMSTCRWHGYLTDGMWTQA